MCTRDFTIRTAAGGASRAKIYRSAASAAATSNFQWARGRKTEFRLSVISFRTRFNAQHTLSQQHGQPATGISMNGKRRITRLVISAVKPHGNHGVSVSRCKRCERKPERI